MNAIYISKDGKLLAMNKPEQSDFQSDVYGGFTKEAYNEALQSSISAAVEFHPNDTVAEDYVIHERGKSSHPIPILLKDCIGRTYPVPDGHSISIEEFWWVDSQEHWRKVSDERESDRPRLPKKTMFALLVRVEEKEELNDVPEVNIKPVYRPVYRSERRLRVIEDLHPDKIIIPVEGKEEPKEEKYEWPVIIDNKVSRRYTPEWQKSGTVDTDKIPDYVSTLVSQQKQMVVYIESLHNKIDEILTSTTNKG